MKKTGLVSIGVVVFFLMVSSVYAQGQSAGKPEGGRVKEGIFKELSLTPEQQNKLEENRKAQRERTSQLREGMMEKEKQLQQTLKDPGVTKVKVEPLLNEIKSLQAQLIDQRVNGIFAVREILTSEQVSKLTQLMEKRKEGRKGRFQEGQKKHRGMEPD